MGNTSSFRYTFSLAIPALFLDRMALSRRLCSGRHPHAAGRRPRWPLYGSPHPVVFPGTDSGDIAPILDGNVGPDLSGWRCGAGDCNVFCCSAACETRGAVNQRCFQNARAAVAASDSLLPAAALRIDDDEFPLTWLQEQESELGSGCLLRCKSFYFRESWAVFFSAGRGGATLAGSSPVSEFRKASRSARSCPDKKSSTLICLSRCGFELPPPM